MRCVCCDRMLSDAEATAKFAEPDIHGKTRYVEMCKKCQSFLPPESRIITRRDLSESSEKDDVIEDSFDLGDFDDESW